jgi:hypothetical protein
MVMLTMHLIASLRNAIRTDSCLLAEVVNHFVDYVGRFGEPVRRGVEGTSVEEGRVIRPLRVKDSISSEPGDRN